MPTPSGDALKELIRSAKPAFTATGVTRAADRDSTFKVIHDGRAVWVIERPTKTELLSGERTILETPDALAVTDMPVAVNNDVKAQLDGKRIAYLDGATLEIEEETVTVARRPCFKVRAWGLNRGEHESMELAVDVETGAILRVDAANGAVFEVTSYHVAKRGLPSGFGG
jgi:hypothetical protein